MASASAPNSCGGLLEDLLLHEMPVRPQIYRIRSQLAQVHLALDFRSSRIANFEAPQPDVDNIAFFKIDDLVRDLQQR
jgi:hypothetical protein